MMTDDVEDGGGGVSIGVLDGDLDRDSFVSDEGDTSSMDQLEDAGLVRRRRPARRGGDGGRYTSVPTNHGAYYPTQGRRCPACVGTVLVVVALALVGMTGFLLGSWQQQQQQQQYTTEGGTADWNRSSSGPAGWFTSFRSPPTPPANWGGDSPTTTISVSAMDKKTFQDLQQEAHILPRDKVRTVRYDPTAFLASNGGNGANNNNNNNNPFDWNGASRSVVTPPRVDLGSAGGPTRSNAYVHHPHLVNNQLVFVSEGDVYLTHLGGDVAPGDDGDTAAGGSKHQRPALSAMKLTTTVGNVGDPKFHPNLPYLAYTATYSGRRDVYLMDLRPDSPLRGGPPMRLTYWDVGAGGVNGLVGWNLQDGQTSLVFRALSNDVSLPDYRLYQIHLETGDVPSSGGGGDGEDDKNPKRAAIPTPAVWQVDPVPLAQAMDGVRLNKCWYFVRYKQTSHTIRYVGGTAESLWKYCDGKDTSGPLIPDGYRGTSKDPQIYHTKGGDKSYLFFLSDRGRSSSPTEQSGWIPDRMNVWAMKLAKDGTDDDWSSLIQITDTSCDFEGRTIQEYSVDAVTGNLVVRIGADLYFMDKDTVRGKLEQKIRYKEIRRLEDLTGGKEGIEGFQVDGNETADSENDNDEVPDRTADDNVSDENVPSGGDLTEADTDSTSEVEEENSDGKNQTGEIASAYDETITSDQSQNDFSQTTADTEIDAGNETDVSTPSQPTSNIPDEETEQSDPVDVTEIGPDAIENEPGIMIEAEVVYGSTSNNNTITDNNNTEPPPAKYYYDYQPPELVSRNEVDEEDHITGHSSELNHLPISVYSDFATQQERLHPVSMVKHFQYGDVFQTVTQSTQILVTLRGQLWVAPIVEDALPPYEEAGKNMPARQYRLVPGAMMGGVTRVLAALHVPNPVEDDISDRRLAVVLATDPLTPTAEHAFYLIETQPGATPLFVDMESLPKPFLGGIVSGGSTRDGGLGSVKPNTLAMSPCGNRMAWSDTDGRIVVMNMPQYQDLKETPDQPKYTVLPKTNELGEPMVGDEVQLVFSPGGRYLAVEHNARNQFRVISIVDLGDPLAEENKIADIDVGRIAQATPARFNSESAYWGQSPTDIHELAREQKMAQIFGLKEPDDVSTTLYFLSDRDITTDVSSPWGYRQRMPHFVDRKALFALPLKANGTESGNRGQFLGGGVEELHVETILERKNLIQSLLSGSTTSSARRKKRKLAEEIHPLAGAFGFADKSFRESQNHQKGVDSRRLEGEEIDAASNLEDEDIDNTHLKEAVFPKDMDIDFGPVDLSFARSAYRVANIPEGDYQDILCQIPGDGSLVLIEDSGGNDGLVLTLFMPDDFPSDRYEKKTFKATLRKLGIWTLSSSRQHFILVFAPDGATRIVANNLSGISQLLGDSELDHHVVDRKGLHISVWPSLEYLQMYNDAWRMLRDYFYDPEMTGIDWPAIHARYLPLVQRSRKREELDDVLVQMAAELSALHVFVYGGEYDNPLHGDPSLGYANEVGSLGASLQRNPAWKGYAITSIPEPDPDFTMIDQSTPIYSPLSEQTLRLSGQRGLQVGDVIVGVNGESVMSVPDIHMLLRGTSGKSIRLDVLRLSSGMEENKKDDGSGDAASEKAIDEAKVESIVTVPLDPNAAGDLLYHAWEWKTEQLAQELASKAGISVGYVHLQDMSGAEAEDAFARGFFPNYQKQGFILDVRHNRGGNIDAWLLDVLQRKPWMYWQSRDYDPTNGGLGWDEHFAFRGHIVVLLDEKTSSDGEGVSRGIAELGLGRLIGTRTWGGGIWLASDNHLVDGGIATAPEIGTYNEHIGWGLGIEQMGVDPDIVVDNDPYKTFAGTDQQLERAIEELKKWIEEEPVVIPRPPEKKKDVTMGDRECKA